MYEVSEINEWMCQIVVHFPQSMMAVEISEMPYTKYFAPVFGRMDCQSLDWSDVYGKYVHYDISNIVLTLLGEISEKK